MLKTILRWILGLFGLRSNKNTDSDLARKLQNIAENDRYLAELRRHQMAAMRRKEMDARLAAQQARIQKHIDDIHKEYEPVEAEPVEEEEYYDDDEDDTHDNKVDKLFFEMFGPLIKGMIQPQGAGNGPNFNDSFNPANPALPQQITQPAAPQVSDTDIRAFLKQYPKADLEMFKKMPRERQVGLIRSQAPGIPDDAIDRALKILREEF